MTSLLDARDKLAAAIARRDDDDPVVLTNLVDSINPPALMIGWAEPWLTPQTACLQQGRMVITAVASRLVPGEGVATLEELVVYTLARLRESGGAWPLESVGGPRVFTIAAVNYLAARITVRTPINA